MKKTSVKKIIGAAVTVLGIAAVVATRSAGIADGAGTGAKALYAASLIIVLLGAVVFLSALKPAERKTDTRTLAMAAMMAALCYIGFAFFKIDIPVPGTVEKTAFHLGNVFCVLAALILGGLWGGMSGAVGMTIADLLTGYITSAPKTFFLKLCIGLITGFVAHKLLHIESETSKGRLTWKTAVSCAAGMGFNVVADPIVGYFYKTYLFGLPQDFAKALAKLSAVTTLFNAVVAVIVATILYTALNGTLKRSGIIGKK